MSRETDCLVGKFRASGLGGVVTSITTPAPGRATGSFHQRWGTPTKADGSDSKGLAIDVAFHPRQVLSQGLLDIFNLYDQEARALAELFYAGASHYVKSGRRYKIAQLSRSIYNDHKDHVHVAVPKGVFLAYEPRPSTEKEARMIAIEPVGSASHPHQGGWIWGRQGHVYGFDGATHYGGWASDQAGPTNRSGRDCISLVPTLTGAGYWLVSDIGEVYAYGNATWPGNYRLEWGAGVIIGAYRNDRLPSPGGLTLVRDDGKNLNTYHLPAI